jgi:hypothetical protein
MKINPKYLLMATAMFLGVSAGSAVAVAAPFFQDHEPDYSKNKTYQQGMRDGKGDHAANKDHSKKRHYKKDEDQKAYEAGYQKGRN